MSNAPTVAMGASNETGGTAPKSSASPLRLAPVNEWLLVAAYRYARHGLNVFPITRDKMPYSNKAMGVSLLPPRVLADGQGGFHIATTNLQQTVKWWDQDFPGANIGARPARDVVVIDIDPRNGGTATWEALTKHREVPETITTKTGSGGWHYWFRLPYIAPLNKEVGAGIDLKAHNGFVVMPPSIHPKTGRHYLFLKWPQSGIAPMPAWMHEYVYKPVNIPAIRALDSPARRVEGNTGDGLIRAVESAPEGSRNNTLHWAACRNAEEQLGLDDELILAAVQAGLFEREARATINSANIGAGIAGINYLGGAA